jgi:cell division protein FtsB
MPSYVWLAMIVLSISALSISTMIRSRDQENEARASYSYLKLRVENAKGVNRQFKDQTAQIKNNPRAAAQAAQDQLRLIRPNEVVVAAP